MSQLQSIRLLVLCKQFRLGLITSSIHRKRGKYTNFTNNQQASVWVATCLVILPPNTIINNQTNFLPQSESFDPKIAARSQYQRTKKSNKIERTKEYNRERKNISSKNSKKKSKSFKVVKDDEGNYVHQSLLEKIYPKGIIDQAKTTLINLQVEENTSDIFDMLENLGLLAYLLPKCNSKMEVAAQLALGLKTMRKGSIIEAALSQAPTVEWLKTTFGYNIFEPQAGEADKQHWLTFLPNLRENWEAVRSAPCFEKISNLISLAASIGLCSVTKLSWNIKGVELFRAGSLRKHATAVDFFGAMLDTVITFIEGGYECFRQGSLAPLLFTTDAGREFDDMYFTLMELHEHAMVFNLAANPITYKGVRRPINDLEYGSMLEEGVEMAEKAYRSAKGTWQASVLEKRLTNLRTNRASYSAKRIDGSLRYAPLVLYLYGGTGVGKSTIAQLVMADCLNAAGASPDPKNTAIIKESDKFDSTLKGDTQGIFFDDMGNTQKEFLEKSPTERLIDINNNMITYANKADLHEKGKIEIRPSVLVVTSNAPLANHARAGSICPESVVRRADLHLEITVKDKYRLPDGRLNSYKAMEDFPDEDFETDVWNIKVHIPDMHNKKTYTSPIDGDLKTDKLYSITEVLEIATSTCKKHFENQRRVVKKATAMVGSRQYCSECLLSKTLCKCAPKKLSTIVEEESFEKQALSDLTFENIKAQFSHFTPTMNAISVRIPERVVQSSLVQKLYMLYHCQELVALEKQSRDSMITLFMLVCSCGLLMESLSWSMILTTMCLCAYMHYCVLTKWKRDMCDRLASRRDITNDLFASLRQSKTVQFFSMCVLAKVLYSVVVSMRAMHDQQTVLAPASVDEIKKRDAEVNPWATVIPAKLHVNAKNATMTIDQLVEKVKGNLFHAKFVENGFQQSCDILALGGTMFLLPLHIFENRKDMKVLVTRKNPDILNSTFRGFVSVKAMTPIPGKDLCIVSIPSGGPHADITNLFPNYCSVTGSAHLLYRDESGEMRDDIVKATYIRNSESGGPGYQYYAPYNTFTGMCMATLVGDFAKPTIIGVHLRGITGTPSSKALFTSSTELKEAIEKSRKNWVGTFPSHVNGTFPVTKYDKQVVINQDVHPKSPVSFLPVGSRLEYVGQNNQRATHTKSDVIATPISPIVEKVTGVPNEFGAPHFHTWKMWRESLAHSSNPSVGIEPSLMDLAVQDYCNGLTEVLLQDTFNGMLKTDVLPLSDMQALCGIDGKRFIDAIPKDTSKGFPLTGPKRDAITLLDPEDYPEFSCPAVVDADILAEAERMTEKLANGERCYAMFKACVKDEPTKLNKDKVRVFQACEFAFQLVIRKYFLPIARLMSLFPLDSECAVGVNAQGPEWDQLARHMLKFGEDRVFAGDYSKYDLRMPASVILAAFKCMCNIAEECGTYTPRDIMIMQGVATEIAYSCVSYNGDVIIHSGSNPSGQNLTVYINCIANSLLMRSAYFKLWPVELGAPIPFRKAVSVMVYGDDVSGSVRKGFDWFNHISYAEFLKERDMVFTMPDKESTPTPYMHDRDADFLKRHNRFNPDTGLIHGTLQESSIFKSLHSVLKSSAVTAKDQSAMNIDGALREWWQYGRDMYELRREQMTQVAKEAGISHMCQELSVTYDKRLEMFREKYM